MQAFKFGQDNVEKKYERNVEVTANRYTIRCMGTATIILTFIWVLNVLDIFIIDQSITMMAFVSFLTVYGVGRVVFHFQDLSRPGMKYWVILWTVTLITILTTALTYHAVLCYTIPIICSTMYSSRKALYLTYVLMVFSTIISVFGGYYLGICDANMVLLTASSLDAYIMPGNTFALTKINDQVFFTLSLFFVFPRCIINILLITVCQSISKIISANVKYAREMEDLAELDGMTGLYNRSKYLSMIETEYRKDPLISVIFWDINDLKLVNDTKGHSVGDKLIRNVAAVIHEMVTDFDKGYRIGGDEFVLIMRGSDERALQKKVQEWEAALAKKSKAVGMSLSVSMGYATGSGASLDEVVSEADRRMYENKRIFHNEHDEEAVQDTAEAVQSGTEGGN